MGVWNFVTRNMQIIAGVSAASLFGLNMIPQTLGLRYYRKAVASYRDGEEEKLPESTTNIIEKVMARFSLAVEQEANIYFFSCFGVDPMHKGCVTLRSGAIIGVPNNMRFHSEEDARTSGMEVNGQEIDWSQPQGAALCEALVLSDRAKAFAMAREVAYCSSNSIWTDGFMKTGIFVLAYSTGFLMNNAFGLRSRLKLWARALFYSVVGGFYFVLYLQAHDIYVAYQDNKADRRAAGLGLAYTQGGVEYYTKVLTRNCALRILMGGEGQRYYTPYGNIASSTRRKGVPFTERRDNLVKFLDVYNQKIAETAESSKKETSS